MKQLTALAWKEWHETRAFLWIALGVFVGLPIIAGLEGMLQYSLRFEVSAVPWVLVFGGVLAIFVSVGATCRDFGGRLEDFWQSRPVGVARWLAVKYFVGLIVVLLACVAPMFLDFFTNRDRDWKTAAGWFLPMLPAFFSLGFLAGCLVRRAAHAAMLALAGMLLIYFLPAIVPPLNWLSAANIYSGDSIAAYIAAMIAIAMIAAGIAFVAVGRGWRVESGRKMMYGAVGVAILILFWSAAYQLGTNMPVLQEVSLPKGETAIDIRCAGNRGYVITRRIYEVPATQPEDRWKTDYEYRSLGVTPSGIRLGEKQDANQAINWGWWAVSPAGHPEISYRVYVNDDRSEPVERCVLVVNDLRENSYHEMVLWQRRGRTWTTSDDKALGFTYCYVLENRLYVIGTQLVTLDISDLDNPKVISRTPFVSTAGWDNLRGTFNGGIWKFASNGNVQPKLVLMLDPIPGLSPMQRLDAMMDAVQMYSGSAFDGKVWCKADGDSLLVYQLVEPPRNGEAVFKLISQYSPSILEAVFGHIQYRKIQMANGLAYVSDEGNWSLMMHREMFNPHVTVFDVRGPGPIRLVGHFAAPGAGTVCPLPDGRAIVGGAKLWLIGPPPEHGAN